MTFAQTTRVRLTAGAAKRYSDLRDVIGAVMAVQGGNVQVLWLRGGTTSWLGSEDLERVDETDGSKAA